MSASPHEPGPMVVEARFNELIARFGDQLSPSQRDQIRTRIERTIAIAASLRETPLTNADEPEIAFAPYRGES